MSTSDGHPAPRVVLCGASNLTLGLETAVATARAVLGEPLEILAAPGHGRSYGMRTRVFGRGLPGIEECSLWSTLAASPRAPTYAVLTDLGNDVAYGVPPERIVAWLESCLDRLAVLDTRVVLTGLPLETIRGLSPWKFLVARSLFFPGRVFSLRSVLEGTARVQERVKRLAVERNLCLVTPRTEWYGVDPIHPPRSRRREVWKTYIEGWVERDDHGEDHHPLPMARLRRLAAARKWILGVERRRRQPCCTLEDGSVISIY